ncbi:VWA domain-containing protein [Salinibaculum rarum]|uniref:VWA domain-containing protein n=1 Tax=Salinibaculum rarum TaxID=3058903 RepID=UPI00265EB440|nr:VWA domain-containing protein [Salinibaculum sp. KK48]
MVGNGADNKVTHPRPGDLSFGEIVGQTRLKEALLAVAANDDLDGLLVRGEKGTAKSTAVRGLVDLLPAQRVIADCPYGCPPNAPSRQCVDCRERSDPPTTERPVPLVTLPLGATRERVVGSLSVADALAGDYEFDPGLLARANRGILYVDEVNLLDDHLVDVLLDAAASGVNRVERDGVSVSHPAEFTLVGTMNPEEGDLRPQLRDRFALQATVTGCRDIEDRVAIVEQALGRKESTHEGNTDQYREQLLWARDHLDEVSIATALVEDIAELCLDAGVDGHRGDIATTRAARTFAALDRRTTVVEADVRRAAELALPHRLQSRPFEDAPDPEDVLDDHFDDSESDDAEGEDDDNSESTDDGDDGGASSEETGSDSAPDESADRNSGDESAGESDGGDEIDGPPGGGAASSGDGDHPDSDDFDDSEGDCGGEAARGRPERGDAEHGDEGDSDQTPEGTPLVPGQSWADVGEGSAPPLSVPDSAVSGDGSGSRSETQPSVDNEGPRVRSEPADSSGQVDAAASVRAASRRGADSVARRDLRQSVRAGKSRALVVFVVDASASMRPAMETAKGTVLELLKDAYQQRDEVAFVTAAGDDADVVLPPTDSVSLAARHLKELPTGDRSPIPAGLRTAREVIDRADPTTSVVVLVTDGRANVAEGSPTGASRAAATELAATDASVVVVDAGDDSRAGVTDTIVETAEADRIPLAALSADRIDATVGSARRP